MPNDTLYLVRNSSYHAGTQVNIVCYTVQMNQELQSQPQLLDPTNAVPHAWHSICALFVKSGLSCEIRPFLSSQAFFVKSGLSCQIRPFFCQIGPFLSDQAAPCPIRRKVWHIATSGCIVHALYSHILCEAMLKNLDCACKFMPVAPA